jgi:hypothetical protein
MLLFNILLIIVGILFGYVLYYSVVRKFLGAHTCLINPSSCLRVFFYSFKNSILIHIAATDDWIWYNGDKIYVYHPPLSSLVCKDKNSEPAYILDKNSGIPKQYECIQSKNAVLRYYEEHKVSKQEIYFRDIQPQNFDIAKIIHYFVKNKYIFLK